MMLMYAQCAISVPQCTLTVYVQYTLATLSLGLGCHTKRGIDDQGLEFCSWCPAKRRILVTEDSLHFLYTLSNGTDTGHVWYVRNQIGSSIPNQYTST